MEKHTSRFYDLRFGILIAIIISILLFKFFSGQTARSVPPPPHSSMPAQQSADTLPRVPAATNNATAR